MIERIKILFYGAEWDEIESYVIEENKERKSIVCNSQKFKPSTIQRKKYKIVVIQFESNRISKNKVVSLIKSLSHDNILSYYFLLKCNKQVRFVQEIIDELRLGEIEIYGIDPDYFFSIVPITGNNHKLIEKYILNLKDTESSRRGKIKRIIKDLLISMEFSKVIYEGYIINIKALRKVEFENINTY